MKEDVKNLWVEALRSGKYKQATGTLESEDGNCCLGVLCRIAIEHGVEVEVNVNSIDEDIYDVRFDGLEAWLPVSVQDWAGMKTSNGVFDPLDAIDVLPEGFPTDDLTMLNDSGMEFSEISDIVEKYWDHL